MHKGDPKKLVTSPPLFLSGSGARTYPYSERPEDKSMDAHFRSGFYLGNGVMHMILSLMPGKPHIVAGLLGYQGDRQVALMFCHCLGVGRKMGRSQLFPSVRLTFIIYYSTFVHLYVSSEDEGVR